MVRHHYLYLLALAGLWAEPVVYGQTPASSPAPPPKSTPPEAVDRLVHDLANPRWAVREAASNALMDAGTAAYRALRSEFQSTSSYDLRRRIKKIAQEIYLAEHLGPPHAFLGIQHKGFVGPDSGDDRVPPWASGLYITDVIDGTGADRAGLRRGDLIMALNGRTGTRGYPAIEFTQWIASQRPGSVCLLNVVRGGDGVRLDVDVIPGFTPAAFANARVRVVRHDDDPRVPYQAAGLVLENDTTVDWKLKKKDAPHIESNDLILALNDELIPLEGTLEHFDRWRRGRLAVKAPDATAPQGPRDPAAPPKPSMHLLRGGRGLDMEVTLGRRPLYLDPAIRQQRGEPTQRDQVLGSFAAWWQETFDPKGLLSDTAEEDPRWELEPRWGGR